MKRVLLLGSTGQVGYELRNILKLYKHKYTVLAPTRDKLNLTNIDLVSYCNDNNPDFIINCAAETNVDGIESGVCNHNNINLNSILPTTLGIISSQHDIPVLHISTDYVFDGTCPDSGWTEDCEVNPLNEYGRYKLMGEQSLIDQTNKYYILRTSWVYSFQRSNFVKTMYLQDKNNKDRSINLVNDQWGHPTSAAELAQNIFTILDSNKEEYGLYNVCGSEFTNWYEFGKKIFKLLNSDMEVNEIDSDTYKSLFKSETNRPKLNKMNCDKFYNTFDVKLLSNDLYLKDAIRQIKGMYEKV